MYVWVIYNEYGLEPIYRFPCQVRMYAKKNGFSVFDETKNNRFDMIVFGKDKRHGFFALRKELE